MIKKDPNCPKMGIAAISRIILSLGLVPFLTMLAFNFLGNGLRDILELKH